MRVNIETRNRIEALTPKLKAWREQLAPGVIEGPHRNTRRRAARVLMWWAATICAVLAALIGGLS